LSILIKMKGIRPQPISEREIIEESDVEATNHSMYSDSLTSSDSDNEDVDLSVNADRVPCSDNEDANASLVNSQKLTTHEVNVVQNSIDESAPDVSSVSAASKNSHKSTIHVINETNDLSDLNDTSFLNAGGTVGSDAVSLPFSSSPKSSNHNTSKPGSLKFHDSIEDSPSMIQKPDESSANSTLHRSSILSFVVEKPYITTEVGNEEPEVMDRTLIEKRLNELSDVSFSIKDAKREVLEKGAIKLKNLKKTKKAVKVPLKRIILSDSDFTAESKSEETHGLSSQMGNLGLTEDSNFDSFVVSDDREISYESYSTDSLDYS